MHMVMHFDMGTYSVFHGNAMTANTSTNLKSWWSAHNKSVHLHAMKRGTWEQRTCAPMQHLCSPQLVAGSADDWVGHGQKTAAIRLTLSICAVPGQQSLVKANEQGKRSHAKEQYLCAGCVVLLLGVCIVWGIGLRLDGRINDILDVGAKDERCHSHGANSLRGT